MKKKQLIHLIGLLREIKKHAEENDMVSQEIDFENLNPETQEEYYDSDIYPNKKCDEIDIIMLHATKTEHKDKLESLLFNVANGLKELEKSPEKKEDVQEDLEQLNAILGPSDD